MKSGCFCPDFKWFLTKWQPFILISNGWAFRFQIPFKIRTKCNPKSFWPFEILISVDFRSTTPSSVFYIFSFQSYGQIFFVLLFLFIWLSNFGLMYLSHLVIGSPVGNTKLIKIGCPSDTLPNFTNLISGQPINNVPQNLASGQQSNLHPINSCTTPPVVHISPNSLNGNLESYSFNGPPSNLASSSISLTKPQIGMNLI